MKINLFLLSCLIFSLTFIFSCESKDETLPSTDVEISDDLSAQLSANTNFREVIKIIYQGRSTEREMRTTFNHTASLVSDIPELIEIEKGDLLELIERSVALIDDPSVVATTSRFPCDDGAGYYACAIASWEDYIISYNACTTNICRANANAALAGAYAYCRNVYC